MRLAPPSTAASTRQASNRMTMILRSMQRSPDTEFLQKIRRTGEYISGAREGC